MNSFLELAASRRSIRKFQEQDIPDADIQYFIQAAIQAPSGCNSQCWRFVAIRSRDVLHAIEKAVLVEIDRILQSKKETLTEEYLSSKHKLAGFFTKAPVVIAVFMTQAAYYDNIFISALREQGYDDEGIMKLYANFDILSIGAAIQNLLLAVHEKGYGACWMNDPAIAGTEINRILGVPLTQKFMSLIPIGVPDYTPREKTFKDLNAVFTII